MIVLIPYSTPRERIERCRLRIPNASCGGYMYTLKNGWKLFTTWCGWSAALVRPDGRLALKGNVTSIGEVGDFNGAVCQFESSKTSADMFTTAGVEMRTEMVLDGGTIS